MLGGFTAGIAAMPPMMTTMMKQKKKNDCSKKKKGLGGRGCQGGGGGCHSYFGPEMKDTAKASTNVADVVKPEPRKQEGTDVWTLSDPTFRGGKNEQEEEKECANDYVTLPLFCHIPRSQGPPSAMWPLTAPDSSWPRMPSSVASWDRVRKNSTCQRIAADKARTS